MLCLIQRSFIVCKKMYKSMLHATGVTGVVKLFLPAPFSVCHAAFTSLSPRGQGKAGGHGNVSGTCRSSLGAQKCFGGPRPMHVTGIGDKKKVRPKNAEEPEELPRFGDVAGGHLVRTSSMKRLAKNRSAAVVSHRS